LLNLEAMIPQQLKPDLFANTAYELKLGPFEEWSFSANWKSCPDTEPEFFRGLLSRVGFIHDQRVAIPLFTL
jgi:hypothetical protein